MPSHAPSMVTRDADSGPSTVYCRRLPFYQGDGGNVLARAETMLEGMAEGGGPTIRWYVTEPRALFLGAGDKSAVVDALACRSQGVSVYRRAAGGGVVVSDGDTLNLDVALPPGHFLWSNDLTLSYRWLGEVWLAALRHLGLPSGMVSIAQARAAAKDDRPEALLARLSCYGGLSPFEVTLDERKVVGFAQVRRRAGVLLQVGVLLRWRPEVVARLLVAPREGRPALTDALATRAIGVEDYTGRPVPKDRLIAAVEEELSACGLEPREGSWSPLENHLIERFRAEHYQPLDLTPP